MAAILSGPQCVKRQLWWCSVHVRLPVSDPMVSMTQCCLTLPQICSFYEEVILNAKIFSLQTCSRHWPCGPAALMSLTWEVSELEDNSSKSLVMGDKKGNTFRSLSWGFSAMIARGPHWIRPFWVGIWEVFWVGVTSSPSFAQWPRVQLKIACVSAQLMLFCSYVKLTQNKVYPILSYPI